MSEFTDGSARQVAPWERNQFARPTSARQRSRLISVSVYTIHSSPLPTRLAFTAP